MGEQNKKLIEATRAMLGGLDSGEEIQQAGAAMGLLIESDPAPEIEIWPDMLEALELFGAASSQWNVGPGGVVGLKYEALPMLMDSHEIPAAHRKGLMADLRIIEQAAIGEMRDG